MRHLYDLARSSVRSHFALINVLARLGLLTRLSRWRATAYVLPAIVLQSATCLSLGVLPIGCDQLDLALACCRLVPRGGSRAAALEEMRGPL